MSGTRGGIPLLLRGREGVRLRGLPARGGARAAQGEAAETGGGGPEGELGDRAVQNY